MPVVALLACLTGLTACGGGSSTTPIAAPTRLTSPTDASPSAAVTSPRPGGASATAGRKPSTQQAVARPRVPIPADYALFAKYRVSGPAVDKFGDYEAQRAYQTAVLITLNEGMDSEALTVPGPLTAASFKPWKAVVTPALYKEMLTDIKAENPTQPYASKYQALLLHNLTAGGENTYRDDGRPVVKSKTFTSGTSTASTSRAALVRFYADVTYRLVDAKGKPVLLTISRDTTMGLTKSGTDWRIYYWKTKQRSKPATADKNP